MKWLKFLTVKPVLTQPLWVQRSVRNRHVMLIQVKLTQISYIGTLFKVQFYTEFRFIQFSV